MRYLGQLIDWSNTTSSLCSIRKKTFFKMADQAMEISRPLRTEVAPGLFRRGADSSDEGAKIWFSGYEYVREEKEILYFK